MSTARFRNAWFGMYSELTTGAAFSVDFVNGVPYDAPNRFSKFTFGGQPDLDLPIYVEPQKMAEAYPIGGPRSLLDFNTALVILSDTLGVAGPWLSVDIKCGRSINRSDFIFLNGMQGLEFEGVSQGEAGGGPSIYWISNPFPPGALGGDAADYSATPEIDDSLILFSSMTSNTTVTASPSVSVTFFNSSIAPVSDYPIKPGAILSAPGYKF